MSPPQGLRRSDRVPSSRLRWRTLRQLERHLGVPMAVLGLIWLALFVVEMTRGRDPLLTGIATAIWILFVIDFVIRLLLAPNRWAYLRGNWLTALSLVVPALRTGRLVAAARALRVARVGRGMRLVRAITSLNRGMGALGETMERRGAVYVLLLAAAVTFAGAAGMYALEPRTATPEGPGFHNYGDALWWTAMIVTTMGSAYWPSTPEGRILAFLLSLFAIGVFGYVTATLASFFIGRDASASRGVAGTHELRAVRRELAELRREVADQGKRAPSDRGM